MKNTRILELLDSGQIEKLKAELRDEIYSDALKNKPGAKQRYAAMKRYFKYSPSVREICQKPAIIEFENKLYTSFCNSHSLALTTEPCGEIELFTDKDRYPDMTRLFDFNGEKETLNIGPALAKAHGEGYKLKTSEVYGAYKYLFKYKDGYYKVGLFDVTFRIIDDGNEVTVYYTNKNRPLVLTNDIGIAVIMPMNIDEVPDNTNVIELKVKGGDLNA